jgi:ubiquinone/menaquinone biosynthesis C-methylase UbiE
MAPPSPSTRRERRLRNYVALVLIVLAGILFGATQSGLFSVPDDRPRAESRKVPSSRLPSKTIAAISSRGLRNPLLNEAPADRGGERQQAKSIREQEGAVSLDAHGSMVAGRGLACPPYDAAALDALQIPLKHLPRKKKTSVREKYDRRAHNCATNGIWNRVTIDDHHKILHGIARLGRIQPNSFVLDWGSGCGHSIQFLFDEMNVTGVGIDVSILTIAYAKENTTKANLHCVADGTKLDWIPDNFFDHSYSFGSIYHVYNRTMFCHVLRQLVRIVRVGGTVYNGWTENAEFKRVHVPLCLSDLPADYEIFEEAKEFANVPIFPLKAEQDRPNTYSLVITKKRDADRSKFLWESRPMDCGVHVCELRAVTTPAPLLGEGSSSTQSDPKEGAEANGRATRGFSSDSEAADHEGWPTCPPYDPAIDALQIPLEHLPRKKKTSVAQKYDRRAAQCATNGVWHRVTIQDHESIIVTVGQLLGLKPDQVVFDWGSGCGHQLEFLTNHFRTRGIGVDVSNLTIAYATANTSKVNRHCVGDGTKLDWIPDNFFDHSYSFGSVYHVYNTTLFCSVLRQMVRITKPGGRIYNGWTENKEFPRAEVFSCVNKNGHENHRVDILEEKTTFHHVQTFPLKKDRRSPNTYSVLIQKESRG